VSAVYGLKALAGHALAEEIGARMAAATPAKPSPVALGYTPVPQSSWTALRNIGMTSLAFDGITGGLAILSIAGQSLADASHRVGVLVYRTMNDTDLDAVTNCPLAYTKYNSTANAKPISARYEAAMTGLWASGDGTAFLVQATLPPFLAVDYGAPADIWINLTVAADGAVWFDVQLFNKTSTRLTEAFTLEFPLTASLPSTGRWMMDKLGSWISPLDVAINGGQTQHGVSRGVAWFDPSLGLGGGAALLTTIDAPVVCPSTPSAPYTTLPFTNSPLVGPVDGFALLLYTNAWTMNFPLWSLDSDYRFRSAVSVLPAAR